MAKGDKRRTVYRSVDLGETGRNMADIARQATDTDALRPVLGYFRSPSATFLDDGLWYATIASLVEAAKANRLLALTRVREAHWPGVKVPGGKRARCCRFVTSFSDTRLTGIGTIDVFTLESCVPLSGGPRLSLWPQITLGGCVVRGPRLFFETAPWRSA